jgi:hypothetical protein
MATGLVTTDFDYDGIDVDAADAKLLEKHATKIDRIQETMRKSTVDAVMAIGEELSIARDRLANHKNGTFRKWAQDRCGLSNGTITNFLSAYDEFKDCKYLPKFGKYIDASALYLLASDNCPEEVTEKAIGEAQAGNPVTHKQVKEWIAEESGDDDTADPSSHPAAAPESAQAPADADRGGVPSDSGFEAFYRDLTEWCASEIKRVGRPLVASWLLGASERMMRE